jgi:hypothetical protein
MDSYIVRIYRRAWRDRSTVVGIVEQVGVAERRAFTDRDELWRILTSAARRATRKRSGARARGGGDHG